MKALLAIVAFTALTAGCSTFVGRPNCYTPACVAIHEAGHATVYWYSPALRDAPFHSLKIWIDKFGDYSGQTSFKLYVDGLTPEQALAVMALTYAGPMSETEALNVMPGWHESDHEAVEDYAGKWSTLTTGKNSQAGRERAKSLALQMAREMLRSHRTKTLLLAKALAKKKELTAAEVEAILGPRP